MKEIPILFSAPMVDAIIAGRKTQTRRFAPVPNYDHYGINIMDWGLSCHPYQKDGGWYYTIQTAVDHSETVNLKCRLCPGDLLYVRETHYRFGHWEQLYDKFRKNGGPKYRFVEDSNEVLYSAPEVFRKGMHNGDAYWQGWYKRNSLFMPKEAARTWLQIENVRVERAQEISDDDAMAEGIYEGVLNHSSFFSDAGLPYPTAYFYSKGNSRKTAVGAFAALWKSINGEESWNENPWVWAISFKVLSTTGKPPGKPEGD